MTVKKTKKSTKRVLKKKYDTATIYYGDSEYWTVTLSEWTMYRDYDWVEFVKNDGTMMECFAVVNVSRIEFRRDKLKDVEPIKSDVLSLKVDTLPLKPVA